MVSLKEFLSEVRQPGVRYTEIKAKNAVVKVIAELSEHEASVFSKIARRFDRLNTAIKKMSEMSKNLNADLKTRIKDLFDAEDMVLTKVVDTASFAATLAAIAKLDPNKKKQVVDWKKIAEELAELIPDELQAQVEAITKKYTVDSIMDVKEPSLTITNKAAEKAARDKKLEEAIDLIKKMAKAVLNHVSKWASSYDRKINRLKKQLNVE